MIKAAAEVATSTHPVPLAINCAKLAVLLYDVYSARGDKLQQFARCCVPLRICLDHELQLMRAWSTAPFTFAYPSDAQLPSTQRIHHY